jgi:hypothetical protein
MATKIKTEQEQLADQFLERILTRYKDDRHWVLKAVYLGDHPSEGYGFVAQIDPLVVGKWTRFEYWRIHREAIYPIFDVNTDYFRVVAPTKVWG